MMRFRRLEYGGSTLQDVVLKEQVDELEREFAELPYRPRYQPIAAPAGPFGIPPANERPGGGALAGRDDCDHRGERRADANRRVAR